MNHRNVAPALALAALATAQTAQAQQQACVNSADFGDAMVYVMPIAFDAARTSCANRLSRDGFMATGGDQFIAKFRDGQDKAWPGAFRLLKVFMADKAKGEEGGEDAMAAMITALPEDSLRPFVDGLVGQMIAKEIKGDSCGKIERGLELVAPLPAENIGGLFAFVAELADLKNPPICGSSPSAPKPKAK
ncbi:hypothetical protein [Porphyrobacter sp. LM 6]|uniref:hypothetical protein n=1 Tax=Porphyrobacter sp. LM 6 TaxID=1896196 RepID=UPI00084798A8|nr:hypothetical protein [Porphyrobacter sp. LM 6]AOL94885.1 hypothetical protein BG023_111968 [Porphyrobacter sp. LM 6]